MPFVEAWPETLVRARVAADGGIEHLHPAEIHGDPVAGGVLCFYHFGWDLLDAVRAAGFARAVWHRTWSAREGLFDVIAIVDGDAVLIDAIEPGDQPKLISLRFVETACDR